MAHIRLSKTGCTPLRPYSRCRYEGHLRLGVWTSDADHVRGRIPSFEMQAYRIRRVCKADCTGIGCSSHEREPGAIVQWLVSAGFGPRPPMLVIMP